MSVYLASGSVERPGTSGRFGDGGNRDILNRNRERIELWFPLRRFGRAADTAGSALFLASERLSGWMTGSTLTVDGGVMAAGAWMRMPEGKGWTHLPMIEGDGYTPRPGKPGDTATGSPTG